MAKIIDPDYIVALGSAFKAFGVSAKQATVSFNALYSHLVEEWDTPDRWVLRDEWQKVERFPVPVNSPDDYVLTNTYPVAGAGMTSRTP